jgi:O-antigen ligase
MTTYSVDAIQGSARTSMWKSSFPWIKDYWLIGSGLDTVKYMYPDYRRSEYGILEGGHNFTPDRLHNEYLNNLATRGVLASLVYYLGIIVGWYLIVVRGYFRFGNNPYRYLLAGCVTGATIYLGQVMFNFGVVATMVLFYVLMGLGWALVLHPDFLKEKS